MSYSWAHFFWFLIYAHIYEPLLLIFWFLTSVLSPFASIIAIFRPILASSPCCAKCPSAFRVDKALLYGYWILFSSFWFLAHMSLIWMLANLDCSSSSTFSFSKILLILPITASLYLDISNIWKVSHCI